MAIKGKNNSKDHWIKGEMRQYILALMASEGRNFEVCEICLAAPAQELHHTRYEGATYYDLQQVCLSCNRKAEHTHRA